MPARCYDDFCTNQNIDETEYRIIFFLMAVILVAAVYGGMTLGNMVMDGLGR